MASRKETDVIKKLTATATVESKSTEDHSKNCCICCGEIKFYAVGACDHPICCKCSARMRVLSNQTYCATCRAEMKQVLVSFQQKKFGDFDLRNMKVKRGYGFHFEEWRVADYFDSLFDYTCTDCSSFERPFGSFDDLKTHIRRAHDKQFCQICLDALSNFPSELKMYTKKELVIHRREGDSEDRSHRGHPECKFCNDRFVDNDTLLFHLRKSHFWCHFCEHDGKQEYYNVYKDLRSHFGEFHFLCDEGDCHYEKFTSVFRDKIDFQAHKLATHGKNFNKMQAKEARKIEFDYSYRKRQTSSAVTASDYTEVNSSEQKHPRGETFNTKRGNQNTLDFSNFEDVEKDRQELKKDRQELKKDRQELKKEKENRVVKLKSPEVNRKSRDTEVVSATTTSSGDSQRFRLIDDDDIIGLPEHINKADITDRNNEESKPVPVKDGKDGSSNKKTNPVQDKPTNKSDKKTEHRNSPRVMEDFPSLPGGKAPSPDLRQKKKTVEEDFPALGKSVRRKEPSLQKQITKSEITHMNGIPVTVKKKKEKGKSWTQQSGRTSITSQDEFPSLQSIDLNQNVEDHKPNKTSSMGNKASRQHGKGPPNNDKNHNPPPGLKEQPNNSIISSCPPGLGGSSVRKKDDKPPGFGNNISESMESNIRERNMRLVALLQAYLDEFNLQIFKSISGDFRKDVIPAREYYSGISELLGDNLKFVFSELVALLPDEKKSSELLKLHQNAKIIAKQKEENVIPYTIPTRVVWGSTSAPVQSTPISGDDETWCADCGETFSRDGALQHMESHGEAFPSLPTANRKKKYMPFKPVHQSQSKNPWTR